MKVLVQSAMIAVMLLHSIWGCCWHHDHDHHDHRGYDHHMGDSATAEHDHGCGHGHGSGHGHSDSSEDLCDSEHPCDSPDHPHVPCDHDECVYLLVKATGVPSSLDVATIACLDHVWPLRGVADVRRCVEMAATSSRSFSALQSCALLQVWRV